MSSAHVEAMAIGSAEGLDAITLRSVDGSTEAEFVPAANMLCRSLSYRGARYLHQGAGVKAYAEEGMTMGIPLLHPWANRLSGFDYRVGDRQVVLPHSKGLMPLDEGGLPIHGVIPGLLRWELDRSTREAVLARVRWGSPELLSVFPFPHELTVEATVATGALTIATTLLATGEESVPVSFGYHPYLRLPGISRNAWRITLGAFRRLVLDAAMIPTGDSVPVARRCFRLDDQVLDDGFDALAVPPIFEATAGDTRLSVEFIEGYAYAQVYAPAGQDFVCFEPMTAPTNALSSGDGLHVVSPGAHYRASFRISVSAAAGA